MPPSVLPSADRTRLNTVQPSMAKAEITANLVDSPVGSVVDGDVLSLIAIAIRRARLKQEFLASIAGTKPSQLSGALNGHGTFNVCWLWTWPTEFWAEFLPLLRAHKEQTEESRRARVKQELIRVIDLLLTEVA